MKKTKKIDNDDPLAGDLSELLESADWRWVKFELRPKNKTITIRVSDELLTAIKKEARKKGLEYQKYIRMALEKIVGKAS